MKFTELLQRTLKSSPDKEDLSKKTVVELKEMAKTNWMKYKSLY